MMKEMTMLEGRSTLSEQLARRLEQMILNDLSQLQTKLPSEQALAMGYGVSRPVVREALAILRERGIVWQKQGGGCYITSPQPDQVSRCVNRLVCMGQVEEEEVFEARLFLEIAASRLAVENATAEDLEVLQELTGRMAQTNGNMEEHARLDWAFHERIADASGNRMLAIFVKSLREPLKRIIRDALQLPYVDQDGVVYHNRIIECLRSRDADAAEEIMRQHIMLSMRNWEVARQRLGK